jgi:hypothetical protein
MIRIALGLAAVTGCELFVSIPSGKLASDGGDADAMADASALGCEDDTQCSAGVCLPDRTCSDPARILYAAPAGAGTACTAAAPCTVQTAIGQLDATRDIVKLAAGTYTLAAALAPTGKAIITGYGAIVTGTGTPIVAPAAGADTTLVGMTFTGTTANQLGIGCISNAVVKISLYKVTVENFNAGVLSTMCEVAIDRSIVRGSHSYGMYVNQQPFTVTRSFFVDNGTTAMQTFGGIYLNAAPSGTVRDTTIANNTANDGNATGVRCTGSSGVGWISDIIYGNTIDPVCMVTYSVVDVGYTGANDATVDPMFVGNGDYHLMPGSPARGLGDPTAPASLDFDGEPRPQPAGSPPDPGADEID